MPPIRPFVAAPPSRGTGRRRRHPALLGAALMSTALVSGPPAVMVGAPPAAASSVTTAAPELRGVLERLAVEPQAQGRATGIPTAWLRTATERIPLDADAVRQVPTGSTIAVRVDPARPHAVSTVRVLVRAASRPATKPGAAVHAVTVVLALPSGSSPTNVTTASLARTVNTGVSRYWSQVSDGRISFTVSKSVTWTRLTSSCSDVWSVWDEARRRSGFVPGARRHLLVYAPTGSGCPTGLATVAGDPDAGGNVIVGGTTTSLIAHELGHNLGLGHSEALDCGSGSDGVRTGDGFGSDCRRVAYGDWYDVMGISWENLGSLSTAHAYRLGLLPASAVATAKGPLRVTLQPVSGRVGIRSLRVQDPSGATYVVEYRPASGVDAWLGTGANWRGLKPGVLLRRLDPDDPTQTLLLDTTPSGAANDVDAPLRLGRTVSTASGRVSISLESLTAGAATVSVSLDGAAPALVLQPRGRLVGGRQITIGQALATWGQLASS